MNGHDQVKLRKKGWNNKEILIENKYVNRKLKNGGGWVVVVIPCHEQLCSARVSRSYFTSDTCCVTLVTNQVVKIRSAVTFFKSGVYLCI
jgi:hypothetical protein